jgi:hypothetical protein
MPAWVSLIKKTTDKLLRWRIGTMKRWHTALLAFIMIPMIAACTAAVRGFPERARTSTAAEPDPDYLLGKNALLKYNQETDNSRKKILRNEIIDARMDEVDARFGDFERDIYKQGVGFGIGTDWAVLGLTATTAIIHGEASKTALGAVSTAVVGGQAAFDKRALFDTALPTLIAQMAAQRESIRASIRASEELAVEDYTIYAALSDLQRFEFAGSIPGSLQSIAEDAGQKAKDARTKINDLQKGAYLKTTSGDLLRKFLKPDGEKINADNEKKLKEWMTENGLSAAPGSITMFLRSDMLEQARIKAVRDLGLVKSE